MTTTFTIIPTRLRSKPAAQSIVYGRPCPSWQTIIIIKTDTVTDTRHKTLTHTHTHTHTHAHRAEKQQSRTGECNSPDGHSATVVLGTWRRGLAYRAPGGVASPGTHSRSATFNDVIAATAQSALSILSASSTAGAAVAVVVVAAAAVLAFIGDFFLFFFFVAALPCCFIAMCMVFVITTGLGY